MDSVLSSYRPPLDWSEGCSPALCFPAEQTLISRLDETGWPLSPRSPFQPNSHQQPFESKRDKKRRDINDQLTAINAEFLLSREQHFRTTLQKLQAELTALHDGTNHEFIDHVEMLEDERDRELIQIEAGRGYAFIRAEREFQEEMRTAEEEYLVRPSPFSSIALFF